MLGGDRVPKAVNALPGEFGERARNKSETAVDGQVLKAEPRNVLPDSGAIGNGLSLPRMDPKRVSCDGTFGDRKGHFDPLPMSRMWYGDDVRASFFRGCF